MPRSFSRKTSSPDSGSLIPLSRTMVFSLIVNLSEDTAVIWKLRICILLKLTPKGTEKPRLLQSYSERTQEEIG